MTPPDRRHLIAAGAAAAVLAAGLTVALVMSDSGGHGTRPPRAVSTVDRQPRVCLLTGARADAATADRAWQGVRRAAADLNTVTVQRYALPSGVAPAAYLGTLTQMRCTVVVTVGDDVSPPAGSSVTAAPHYIAIAQDAASAPGVVHMTPAAATDEAVAAAVTAAVHAAPAPPAA